jgi:hypothetical protein
MENRRPEGSGSVVVDPASRHSEPTPKRDQSQTRQPEWVPELIGVLVELHRRRESRHAFASVYARKRGAGRYPDHAA